MNRRGIWERIGLRPWRLAVLLLGFAIMLVGVPLALRGFFSLSGVCTGEEREVYAKFPQYGNIGKEPQPFTDSGGCAVFYDTRASQERVAEYYAEQLKAHGWTVQQRKGEVTVFDPKKRMVEQIDITAHRDDHFYNVLFESHEMNDPPRPGAHVAVHVGKGYGNRPLVSEGHRDKALQPSDNSGPGILVARYPAANRFALVYASFCRR